MGTAINHPVPDRVKPSFVIFDIRALWRSYPYDNSGRQRVV